MNFSIFAIFANFSILPSEQWVQGMQGAAFWSEQSERHKVFDEGSKTKALCQKAAPCIPGRVPNGLNGTWAKPSKRDKAQNMKKPREGLKTVMV